MGHDYYNTNCTSTESWCQEGPGVPNVRCFPLKCDNPFLAGPSHIDFECSTIQCNDGFCKPPPCGDLCDTETMSSCPKVDHCVKKDMNCSSSSSTKKNKRNKCVQCGFTNCKCEQSERCLAELLCYDESDSCSDQSETEHQPKCGWNTPSHLPFPVMSGKPGWCDNEEKSLPSVNNQIHKIPQNEGKQCRKETKTFRVTLGPKNEHPWRHRIVNSNQCFFINGKSGKTLHLDEGVTYKFTVNIQQPSGLFGGLADYFYFTDDPQGGRQGFQSDSPVYNPLPLSGSFSPLLNGVVEFYVDPSYPPIFYYQSKAHPCMGYMVVKHKSKNV